MRKLLLIGAVLVLPMNAMAQTAQTAPSLAEGVPTPRVEGTIDGYRVAAIAAGAVVGVIVANVVTGGMITPVLLAGAGEAGVVAAMPAVAEGSVFAAAPEAVTGGYYAAMAAQTAVTAAGALIGGYVGNWVYGD